MDSIIFLWLNLNYGKYNLIFTIVGVVSLLLTLLFGSTLHTLLLEEQGKDIDIEVANDVPSMVQACVISQHQLDYNGYPNATYRRAEIDTITNGIFCYEKHLISPEALKQVFATCYESIVKEVKENEGKNKQSQ
jgi:hypothetical protein